MIHLKQIQFSYPQSKKSLDFPDLMIENGERVAVVGASGAGKSTLLNIIAGFLVPKQGSILLDGIDHSDTRPHQRPVSMLFQNNNLFNHLSVEENLILGLHPKLKIDAVQRQSIHDIAEKVGLESYLNCYPDKLSGGQQQRVALARCMLRDQPILLLDEPFSALDKALRVDMLSLLNNITSEKQLTVMLITHQPEEINDFVSQTLTLPL